MRQSKDNEFIFIYIEVKREFFLEGGAIAFNAPPQLRQWNLCIPRGNW